jgi:hypothetical protein
VRELHVVGMSADGRHVLLAGQPGASRPTHALVLDERLDRVLRGQSAEGDVAPALSPKEIQTRIRAGASVEQLALESGMATTRIARYAGPVLGEREQELAALLACTQVSRRGTSAQPLGAAVDAAVSGLAYLRPESVTWIAYRREEGAWVARLSLVVRGREKVAEWMREPSGVQLRPADSWAAGLGHVESGLGRRRARVAAVELTPAKAKAKAAVKVPAKAKAKAAVKVPAKAKAVRRPSAPGPRGTARRPV